MEILKNAPLRYIKVSNLIQAVLNVAVATSLATYAVAISAQIASIV